MATFIPPNNEEGFHVISYYGNPVIGQYQRYTDDDNDCVGYWSFVNPLNEYATDGSCVNDDNFPDDDVENMIYVRKWEE